MRELGCARLIPVAVVGSARRDRVRCTDGEVEWRVASGWGTHDFARGFVAVVDVGAVLEEERDDGAAAEGDRMEQR